MIRDVFMLFISGIDREIKFFSEFLKEDWVVIYKIL